MAKVYALMNLTDPSGEERAPGDEFDWPRETDRDKADYATAIERGIVSENLPAALRPEPKPKASSQRTPPRERQGQED